MFVVRKKCIFINLLKRSTDVRGGGQSKETRLSLRFEFSNPAKYLVVVSNCKRIYFKIEQFEHIDFYIP